MSLPPEKTSLYILSSHGIKVNLHVLPSAASTGFAGLIGNRLKLRLAAKAVDGEANRALCKFLSKAFGVPKSCISILHGETGRDKTLLICGNAEQLANKLKELI